MGEAIIAGFLFVFAAVTTYQIDQLQTRLDIMECENKLDKLEEQND